MKASGKAGERRVLRRATGTWAGRGGRLRSRAWSTEGSEAGTVPTDFCFFHQRYQSQTRPSATRKTAYSPLNCTVPAMLDCRESVRARERGWWYRTKAGQPHSRPARFADCQPASICPPALLRSFLFRFLSFYTHIGRISTPEVNAAPRVTCTGCDLLWLSQQEAG